MSEDNTQKDIVAEKAATEAVDTKESSGAPESEKMANVTKKNRRFSRRALIKIALCVLVVAIVGGGIFGGYWMVYRTKGTNAVKTWLVNTLPFPVAMVDGESILLRDFNANVRSAEFFFDQQVQQGTAGIQRPSSDELYQNELDRMVDLTLMEQVAKQRNVSATDQEVDEYFTTNILPQANNSLDEVNATLQKLYGWTVDDFKKQVLYPVVLKQKVQKSFSDDTTLDADAKAKADSVYTEVTTSGTEFSELAKKYSDDSGTAPDGGMLGTFAKGVMVKEFEDAAFALQIGEVSQPIKTIYGYHLIKVTNRDDSAGTVEARHILIATKNVDDAVNELRGKVKIRKYLPVL